MLVYESLFKVNVCGMNNVVVGSMRFGYLLFVWE